jgi:hypothetical protein
MDFLTEAILATTSTIGSCYDYVSGGIKTVYNYWSKSRKEDKEANQIFNDLERKLSGEE